MITVGLDLSLTSTGVARIGDYQPSIFTVPTNDKHPLGQRLDTIKKALWPATFSADLIVIEDLPTHAKGAGKTAMVHGLIRWMLWRDDYETIVVTPATLKVLATGKGNAGKEEVLVAAVNRLGYAGHSTDEADALWLAHLGAHYLGQPAVDLPATHLRALAKLTKAAA